MHQKSLFVLLLLTMQLFSVAQNYVTLHDQCNYSGRQYTLEPGNYKAYQMKIGNDKLNSFQIPSGFKITLYEHDDFKGKSKTFYASENCLSTDWRNAASSIVVEGPYGYQQPGSGGYGNEYITFFADCYSKGYSQSLRPGTYTGSQLGALKYAISSFVITGNLRLRVYLNNENAAGASAAFETSQSCFSKTYNDKIGSLVIEYKSTTPTYPTNPGSGNYNSNSYATLYSDCNYNGNAIRLMPGTYQGNQLGLMRYNISSINLGSNLRARVYLDNEYASGSSYPINADISCMNSNLRNRIGSVIIEEKWGNNPGYTQPGAGSGDVVIIYTDANYKGQAASLLPGTYRTMAEAGGFPNKSLSSLQLPAGFRVVLYENENFGGKSYTITESKTGFSISGWNDRTSSIAVYRN